MEPTTQETALTKRHTYVQTVLRDWWTLWYQLVFPTLAPCYRWQQRHQEIQVGDVVLMKYAGINKGKYRLARVTETRPSHDGLVRAAKLKYHTSGGQLKFIDRPLQSLVLIVPIEEQKLV